MSEGQVFPVQSTVQLTPPYSLYLSDYAAPGSERLSVTAFLVDATRPELNVRFRLRIEGNGIKIETKPEFLPPPVTLLGGVPLQLISSDLAAYFDPRNLNFTGITQREYEQRGALPEGLYQFCLEVLEYNRGVKISNTGCAVAWLILNDPPIVNLPRDNEKIRIQDPQQVIFQWTPRHRGSPNSAFNAEYDFKLVEVWPSTRNPNDAILTSPVIFQTTTSETTLIYGPAETPLEPGRRYAFQIRARAYAGADEVSLFKNNGFSQVYTFVYGDACLVPQNIVTSDIGTTRFTVNFDGAPNQTNYTLRYRLSPVALAKGDLSSSAKEAPLSSAKATESAWYTTTSLTPNLTINSLQPNTRYEFQVNAGCGTFTSDYSLLTNVTTKDNPGIQYSCGVPLTPFNLDPSQLINSLKIGDVIKAGDFDVILSKVSGSNGTFSGEGVIEVSYFNRAKVKAEFTNINVSNEMRMVNGYMNVTGAGVEVVPAGVMDLMDELDELLAKADEILGNRNIDQFDENAAVTSTLITVPGPATISQGVNGSVVIVDASGKRTELPKGTTASVEDGTGKGYIIDSKGKVHSTTAAIATQAANREYNLKLKFAASAEQKFGFDEKRYDQIASTYTKIENQYLSWKSVATGQADKVIATLEGNGIDKSKIRFELNGAVVNSQWSSGQSPMTNDQSTNDQKNDQSTIGILGAGDGVESELIALYDAQAPVTNNNSPVTKTQVLGKLSVVTYDQIVKDLMIVPVNGNKYPYDEVVLRTQLNKIYGQAVVTWNITFASNFDVPGIDPFDDGGSGLLSNYSPDMRKVVSAYKANLQRNTYYLFLVKNPKSGTLAGFMPRSKSVGFIFLDKNGSGEELARTIAHELGHGAFQLRHTFADERNTLPKGTTTNLMDYVPAEQAGTDGTKLYKYQWDRVRYREIVIGLFEGDDAGALSLPCLGIFDDCSDVLAILKGIKARMNKIGPSLPVYKPDPSKNRKALYEGNYLNIDGVDYAKIIIRNETTKDEVIDPKIYYNYSEGKGNDFKAGFMFKLSDNSLFKILVVNEKDSTTAVNKREKLGVYLFSNSKDARKNEKKFSTQIKNGETVVNESNFVLITTEPSMPALSVKAINPNSSSEITFRLKIEYRRDIRQDEDYFPSDGWKKIKANEKWVIDFGNKIRGGKATLYCDYGTEKDTIIFHIRGTNPTEQSVKDYLSSQTYDIWFLTRMIRQESNYRHINAGTNYGSGWNDSQGCPNFGPPHGWGLMQLDLLDGGQRPTAQELWSWKANVDRGYQFLNGEKRTMVNNRLNSAAAILNAWHKENGDDEVQGHTDQIEGTITYTHARSANFDHDFGAELTGLNKSFADAAWIKNYNGSSGGIDGYPGFYYLVKQFGQSKPFWDLHRTNNNGHNYVEAVSNRID